MAGTVRLGDEKNKRIVYVVDSNGEEREYEIPPGTHLLAQEGQRVEPGDQLNEGSLNPHDILRVKGETALQNYLVQEVQKVYRSQGVDINDKHIEVIVRSMLRKVKIVEGGDTNLLPGQLVEAAQFHEANERMRAAGKELATANPVLLGVTKASLATESFLSAASFQETTRVLTDAAIKGKYDPLLGLKENVIIGKLIPAGTGMSRYRNVDIVPRGSGRRRRRPAAPRVRRALRHDDRRRRGARRSHGRQRRRHEPVGQRVRTQPRAAHRAVRRRVRGPRKPARLARRRRSTIG